MSGPLSEKQKAALAKGQRALAQKLANKYPDAACGGRVKSLEDRLAKQTQTSRRLAEQVGQAERMLGQRRKEINELKAGAGRAAGAAAARGASHRRQVRSLEDRLARQTLTSRHLAEKVGRAERMLGQRRKEINELKARLARK